MLSVILPTYNERENIQDLISAFLQYAEIPLEVIVVDDDSPDRTWELVAEMQAEHSNLRLIRRTGEKGLATAIAEGVANAKGDILTWMDCDFSHPPALLPGLLHALDRCDIAIASRYVKNGRMEASPLRVLTSRLINLFANLVLGFSVRDWTSGFIVIRREVLDVIPVEPMGKGYGEYFIALMFRAGREGFKIEEVPYTYSFRQKGSTKTSPSLLKFLGYGFSYCWSILALRANPGKTRGQRCHGNNLA